MKDPAFLFYSKDFYEGTRMMLPEERACYLDLLIYQHQNGSIPLDLKRVLMYCSGVDKATLEATLKEKFEKTEDGYINLKLDRAINDRNEYKIGQSESGKIGQFFKKAKAILTKKDYSDLQKLNKNKAEILDFISTNDINEGTLKALLKRCLSNKANAIANAIEDVNTIEIENENEVFDLKPKIQKNENDFQNEIQILVEVYQNVTARKFKAIDTIVKNYAHWRATYTPAEIEQAITNIPKDKFWSDKMTPVILFRQRNPNGENVDYIGGLLEYTKTANEKQRSAAMSATAQYLESLN
jgi:uncharacterized protein YdaU (DUF1376 family)